MRYIIWLLLMATTAQLALAQTYRGTVFDSLTKEPLQGVSINLKSGQSGAVTGSDGSFNITSIIGNNEFIISMSGYFEKKVLLYPDRVNNISMQPASNNLQEVIVTANRTATLRSQAPVAISRISPKVLDEAKATQIFEVINKVPGVVMVSYNNEQHGMSIRQPMGTSNYYLYMEDGIPIRPMGVFNHNALLEVNQFTIGSIEVVKGPVSSLYGPEAVGGAINFLSQRPTVMPTAKLGVQFDQFGYRRVQLSGGSTFGKFSIYAGGLVSNQTNSWMANSDYSKNSWNARLEYHLNNRTKFTGTFMFGYYFSNTSGSVDNTAFYSRSYVSTTDFTYRKSTASRNRITLEHDWNTHASSSITVFHRFNKGGQNPSYAIRWVPGQLTARGEINSNDFSSYGLMAQHSQKFSFLNSNLLVGGMFDYSPNEYNSYQIDLTAKLRADGQSVEKYEIKSERPDIVIGDYDAKIKNGALYTQLELEPFKKFRLSAGIRYDLMSFSYTNYLDKSSGNKKFEQLTPKLGFTYDLGKGNGFYGNYSRGFAPPGLSAIFRRKPNSNPAEFYYNLEPGQFENYELGGWLSLMNGKVYVEIAAYQMNGKNELLNIRQPDNSFDYSSAGKTLHRGVEYTLQFKPSKQVNFRFGGTTALHRYEDFQISVRQADAIKNLNSKEMPGSPRTTFNTELSYYPAWLKGFRSAIEWQHVDGWYQNQINTVRYTGYDLLNCRFGYVFKGVELFTHVMNVTNSLYSTNATRGNNATDRTTFIPSAPRTFVMGIQYNFTAKKQQ